MKKIAAIFLISIYLFSATDLKELLKLDVVVQHFRETKQLDNSVSFFHFIVMHYVTDDDNDKDNERDSQLPFKSPHTVTAISSLVSIPNKLTTLAFQSFAIIENDFSISNDSFVLSNYQSLVWHPPQLS